MALLCLRRMYFDKLPLRRKYVLFACHPIPEQNQPVRLLPVIILEDIVDTGKTLSEFLPQIQQQQPTSVAVATLLHKPDATRFPVPIQYCCFSIPNKFVLGYGLDFNGLGRNLPGLYQLKEF